MSTFQTTLSGIASAFGHKTAATGEVFNILEQNVPGTGGATIAFGEAIFHAQASTGGAVAAAANTALQQTGADILLELHISNQSPGLSNSELEYIAIDIPGYTGPPEVLDFTLPATQVGNLEPTVDALITQLESVAGPILDSITTPVGSVAFILSEALAYGPNALASTVVEATTVYNKFSLVHGSATVATIDV